MAPKHAASSSTSSFSMEKLSSELAGLASDEERVKELLKRLQSSETQREALAEKAAVADKYKKACALMEDKQKRQNNLLLKTEESKAKLEELCRELQRVNKEIREDSVTRLKAMEAERGAAVEKLRLSLKSIEQTMQEGHGKSDQLATENQRLAGKLAELAGEYRDKMETFSQQNADKEKYWVELQKAHQAEARLLRAKLETMELHAKKSELEKEELTRSLLEGTARVGGAIESERQLREQVKEYSEKYSSLHKSLAASNDAFDRFRKEIDRVNSKLAKVETEANKWKAKYDEASKNILVLTLAKKELEDAAALREKQLKTLESLCRELSARKGASPPAEPTTQ